MSFRHSSVEKHSGHGKDQCGVRRSTRSESALSLKNNRGCCAPYPQPPSRKLRRHQVLSANALIASSPTSCSESAWLHYSCKRSTTSTSPFFSKPCGKRDLSVNGSILDMTQRRQLFGSGAAGDSTTRLSTSILSDYALRVLPSRLRENEFNFEETKINKIFASHWLNERQVVMGTKCNKLLVFDVVSHQVSYIPMLKSSGIYPTADPPCGIHAISINPSSTLLATGGHSTNDVAIYALPTFDPIAVCENGHADWVFGIDWIDDQFFVSGSRDSNICLYRVNPEVLQSQSTNNNRTKANSRSSSSSFVDSGRYHYSTSQAPHAWTTVSSRSSVNGSRAPVQERQVAEDESEPDYGENHESGDAVVNPSPFASIDALRLHHLTQNLTSLRRDYVAFGAVADGWAGGAGGGGGEEEEEEEEEDEDDDDGGNDGEEGGREDDDDGGGGPRTPPLPSGVPPDARRTILTPVRVRRQPRTLDLWDMDEIEDEQVPDCQSRVLGSRRLPTHPCVTPLETLNCDRAEKIRAVAYNKWRKQVATLSLNAFFHLIDVETFRSAEEPLRLPHTRENVCMSVNEDGSLFAIGSQSHVTFVDPRVLKLSTTRSILCKQRGCGIRSLSFKNDLLTIGTGQGSVYFYDVRAEKYLELFCGASVSLEAGMGWLNHDDTYHDFFVGHEYPNAVYTHCYDPAGTRLFTAGGPLPAGLFGNYAALWY